MGFSCNKFFFPILNTLKLSKQLFILLIILAFMDTCEVHFIDCMGYWDLASEILSLALIAFITLRTLKNIINLNLARRDESN